MRNSQCWLECEYEESNDDPLETEEETYRTLSVSLSVSMRSLMSNDDPSETEEETCGTLSVGLSVSMRSLMTTPEEQKKELAELLVFA